MGKDQREWNLDSEENWMDAALSDFEVVEREPCGF